VKALVSISRQSWPSRGLEQAFGENVGLHNLYLSLLRYASLSENETVDTSTFLSHDTTLKSDVQIRTAVSRKNGAYMPIAADNQQFDRPMLVVDLNRSLIEGNFPTHLLSPTPPKTNRNLGFTRREIDGQPKHTENGDGNRTHHGNFVA